MSGLRRALRPDRWSTSAPIWDRWGVCAVLLAVLAAALLGYDGFTSGATLAAVASLMTCLVIRQFVMLRVSQQRLDDLTLHDPLTGLPNRALLLDRVSHALARAQRRGGRVAALFVDLDNFKLVNDSLGHQAGDELLVSVAGRVRGCLRDEDTLARLGGDELAILIEDVHDEADVIAVAERVQKALARPFEVGGHTLFTTASIGLALSGPTVHQASSLLRNADLAMYQAKTSGKSRWARFDPVLNDAADERLELETALRAAVERGELWVAYQPMVNLETGTVREVEALLRWQHPTRGSIPPARFIPVAEASGLIVQIGGWVLAEACRQAARWQTSFLAREPLSVSVNLSGRQLQDPTLVETVAQVLVETGLDGAALKLELTESVVMESTEATLETLTRLRALGVRLAIDDFGTGYSSFAYLKRFSVDALKIDRSFVAGLGRDAQDGAIVQSVISLARGLGLTVTGEGVETAEQAVTLRQLGCNLAQGYYYARPLAPAQIEPILATLCPRDEPDASPPDAHDERDIRLHANRRIVPFPDRAPRKLPRVP